MIGKNINVSVSLATAENDRCRAKKELASHLYVAVLVSAACIILVLCLVNRRTKYCKNFLCGIPNIVIPVDLLSIGSSGYRLVYCVILGCWGADLLHNVLDHSLYYTSQYSITDAIYFFMFSPTVIILTQAWIYFPVFACVDTFIPILTHSLGLLYTSLVLGNNVYADYIVTQGCSYRGELSHREIGISVGSRAWTYLLYVCLLLLYFMYSVFDIVHVLVLGQKLTRQKCHSDHAVCEEYVKILLKNKRVKTGDKSQHIMTDNLWNYLVRGFNYVIPNIYTFYIRYPLPLLGAFFMGFAMITHLVILWSAHEFILAENLLHWLQEFQITVTTIEDILPSTKPYLNRLFSQVLSFAKAYQIILPFGSVVSFGLCSMFAIYMIQNTHKQFLEAARGDTDFIIRSEPVPSLAYRLAATMRFTAFQVAFLVCSWMIYSLILWVLMSIGLGFYYSFNDFRHFAIHFWSWFMVPMMWGAAMYSVQLFLCKHVFLERHRGTLPIIRLQWLYHILTYFLFFFNCIFGFVMCVLRVFAVCVFTVVMLFRLDWDVYMRGLEGWDTGHRTYMAYIYMEYSYNNMIMRHFSHLLLETLHKRRSQHRVQQRIPATLQQRLVDGEVSLRTHSTMTNTSNGFNNDLYMCSHRARLRWHLAFTLLRNQSLCQDRVHSHHYNTSTATVDYGATATLDTCKTNHTHFEEWS